MQRLIFRGRELHDAESASLQELGFASEHAEVTLLRRPALP